MALPTSGAAWTGVTTWAAKTPNVNLADLDADGDVVTLAKALVFARTGDRRAEVVTALGKAQASGVSRALELARGLGAYVLAADLVAYRDAGFVAWVKAQHTRPVTGGPANLDACSTERPNNWGTWCRSSRLIIERYLGESTATSEALFRGWLGDRTAYAGYAYGDTSWQADASKPVGINPKGALKSGRDIDGVLPDDQRRAGSFTWPPPCENYVHEALQGATLEAAILGPTAWTWSDAALARAYAWLYPACPATGDDTNTPFVVDHFAGTSYAGSSGAPGKGFGFADWLWP